MITRLKEAAAAVAADIADAMDSASRARLHGVTVYQLGALVDQTLLARLLGALHYNLSTELGEAAATTWARRTRLVIRRRPILARLTRDAELTSHHQLAVARPFGPVRQVIQVTVAEDPEETWSRIGITLARTAARTLRLEGDPLRLILCSAADGE